MLYTYVHFTVTTSTSPIVSPVLVGGVNAAAVAVPVVLILLLVVIATVVGVVLLVYCRRRSLFLLNNLVLICVFIIRACEFYENENTRQH